MVRTTWLRLVALAITAIFQRTGEEEMAVPTIREEAIAQAKKVRFGSSARAKVEVPKGLSRLMKSGHILFVRDDDDAGRWEDGNTVILTEKGVDLFRQLIDVVIKGPNGHPKAEEDLSERDLRKLHASRLERFENLTGRLPPMPTVIQFNRDIRKLTRKTDEAERQTERYKAEIDSLRSTVPMNTGTGPVPRSSNAAEPSRPAGGIDHPTGIPAVPSAATHSRDGTSGMGGSRNSSEVSVPRTPKPLARTSGSSGSFIFGGLASPNPRGDMRLPDEDMMMDIDNPSSQRSSGLAPVTPAAQRTTTSHGRLAYPSPISAQRRSADAGPENVGQLATPSKGVQAGPSESPASLPRPTHTAKSVISYLWSRFTPFASREDQREPDDFQEAIDSIVKERQELLERVERGDLCKEELMKNIEVKDDLIASLRQRNTKLIEDAMENLEKQKKTFADYLSSDACSSQAS